MIRLIVKSSGQVSEDQWSVFYETFEVDCPELENKMRNGCQHVVGAEVVKTPTSDNNDYRQILSGH